MRSTSGSVLDVDHAASFGLGVGTGNYTGPLLENFGVSQAIDLKDFAVAGVSLNFDSANGLLQLTHSSAQTATLEFQVATLGSGTFHAASDGGTGLLLTRS